jgi:hypothetical protein
MSIDRRRPVTDYHGQSPCIEPHILGRILDKLKPLRAKVRDEANTKADAWAGIDALAKSMEAAR